MSTGSGFRPPSYQPRPQSISDPASVFGKGIAPTEYGQTGGMQPIPQMPQYGELNAPIDKTTSMPYGAPRGFGMPFGLQGRPGLPPRNPFAQNYASVAGYGMPQQPQSLAAPKAATAMPSAQMPSTQQPYLIRPTPQPPPPQGPAQQGQAGYQWGQANSINGDGDVGWQPAFGPAAKAYVAQMTNTASGVQPWLGQVNWSDALNSIGQLSGTPFNPAIWGNL